MGGGELKNGASKTGVVSGCRKKGTVKMCKISEALCLLSVLLKQ